MSVLVVGSTALDSIKTPTAENPRLLGGSASHAAVAASFFTKVSLVGIVGDDFPRKYVQLYRRHGINLDGLQVAPGKTFHWSGEYEVNMNNRRTLTTELGVFETFSPKLPETLRRIPYVLLANIAPTLQHHVLDQIERPKFVIADTMDLWINIALPDLLKLLRRVDAFVLNDSEAQLLTQETNLVKAVARIHRLGPKYVILKKGEHGSMLSSPRGVFLAPACPLSKVVDPTGAGDSFVGGLLGYIASRPGRVDSKFRRGILYGSAVASFCCEGFGLTCTTRTKRAAIEKRVQTLEKMIRI
ncbi:MAG: PfkB family carbohydrate kinase [Verrucomicrobiota bacterium]